jgi:hypothetical protein
MTALSNDLQNEAHGLALFMLQHEFMLPVSHAALQCQSEVIQPVYVSHRLGLPR